VIVLDFDLEKERNPQWLDMYLTAPTREAIKYNYKVGGQIEIPFPERFNPQDRFYIYIPKHFDDQSAVADEPGRLGSPSRPASPASKSKIQPNGARTVRF
jgi:hypothetical protein